MNLAPRCCWAQARTTCGSALPMGADARSDKLLESLNIVQVQFTLNITLYWFHMHSRAVRCSYTLRSVPANIFEKLPCASVDLAPSSAWPSPTRVPPLGWLSRTAGLREIRRQGRRTTLSGFIPVAARMALRALGAGCGPRRDPWGLHPSLPAPHEASAQAPGPSLLGRRRNSSRCEHTAAECPVDACLMGHFCGLWRSQGYVCRPRSPEPGLSPRPGAGCPPATGPAPAWDPEQRRHRPLGTGVGPEHAHRPHVRGQGGHVCPWWRTGGVGKAASRRAPPAPAQAPSPRLHSRPARPPDTCSGQPRASQPSCLEGRPGPGPARKCPRMSSSAFLPGWAPGSHSKARCPAGTSIPGATGQALPGAADGGSEASRQGAVEWIPGRGGPAARAGEGAGQLCSGKPCAAGQRPAARREPGLGGRCSGGEHRNRLRRKDSDVRGSGHFQAPPPSLSGALSLSLCVSRGGTN